MQPMEEIYQEYAKLVYRYLLSLAKDPDLAEELTQETFFQAIRSIGRYDESCKISTWLIAIAKNALSTWRRKHPATEDLDQAVAETPSAESLVSQMDGQVEIMKAIQRLPEETREVMYIRLLGDLSFRQIGEIMQRTENWARVTYFRGREKLKKELDT